MKKILLPLLALFCVVGSKAQTAADFERSLMKTQNGFKLIYNSKSQSITLDITSAKIDPIEDSDFINIDQNPVQFNLINYYASNTANDAYTKQQAELLDYSEYELNYEKNDLKVKISGIHKEWVTINKKLFLLWYYNMPPDNKSILQQVNLSTLCFANVLNISTPVCKNEVFANKKTILMVLAKTLKMNNFELNLGTLSKQIKTRK